MAVLHGRTPENAFLAPLDSMKDME